MSEVYKEITPPALAEYGIEFFKQKRECAGVMTRAHIHPAIEFVYIMKGIFEIGIDGELISATPGDLILFRANVIHTIRNTCEGVGEYFVLKVNPSQLFQIFLGKGNNGCIASFLRTKEGDRSFFPAAELPQEITQTLDAMMREYYSSDRFFFAFERAYAAEFLVLMLRTLISPRDNSDENDISEKSVALIYDSVKYINENYASDITPADCAAQIHLSYSYFAKLFRAVMGKTFKEYLTGVRLAKAHNILLSTDIPVTDVAASCGYINLSYFISEYRKIYGLTPTETRKKLYNS